MTLEQKMAQALEGKFFAFASDGLTVFDTNAKPPVPPPPPMPKRDWLVLRAETKEVTFKAILALVAEQFNVTTAELRSARREYRLVRARHTASWLGIKYTTLSFPRIGKEMGGRDHSTIWHGVKAVQDNMKKYEPELSRCISELQRKSIQPEGMVK